MYERHFGLKPKPFALTPDPAYLYLAKRHRHALTMLEYALAEEFISFDTPEHRGVVERMLERSAEKE